ncbi:uncharacterized protein SCHCODRAFT_02709628 [Schizophyllum commune H4-8]|uniref:Ubiquitin-like protease family profile domain-containing protein n=1 Tax=Schizophyllum commune (strain H4-8 / FGSC 9210) TaxID=578458 RepID=D8PWB6_SCHCM|nr:uncharacterized protein SCHCODRAFT_02709628 [Schizophyllum commune H4-8]KAI5900011.1 hypothetical protein SCHCODRAFT_02709628 [Schizophyllum commune H4-8]
MSNPDPEAAQYQAAPPIENMGTPVDLGSTLSQEDETPAPKDCKGKAKAKEAVVAGSVLGSVGKGTCQLFGHPVSKEVTVLYKSWQDLFCTWVREGSLEALLQGHVIDKKRLSLRANAIERDLYASDYPRWQAGYNCMKMLHQCTRSDPVLSAGDEFLKLLLHERAPPDCVSAAFQASNNIRDTVQAARTHYQHLHLKFIEWGSDMELPRRQIAIIKSASFTSIRVLKRPIAAKSPSTSAPLPASYFTLNREHILRLASNQWLNDEIINFFIELFMHNPQSHHNVVVALMSQQGTKLAARFGGLKLIDASNVKDLKLLLIPLHVHGNHWCLFVMDFVNRHGTVYDSLLTNAQENRVLFQRMRDCMQAVWELKKLPVDKDWWRTKWQWFADPPDVPRQNNAIDCGIYCMSFMVHLHKWGKINHKDIPVPLRIPLHKEGIAALARPSGRPKPKKASKKCKRKRASSKMPLVLIDEDTEEDAAGTADLVDALNTAGGTGKCQGNMWRSGIRRERRDRTDGDGNVTMSSQLQIENQWPRTRGSNSDSSFGSLDDEGDDSDDCDEDRIIDDEGVNQEDQPLGANPITLKPPSELGAMLAEAEAEAQTHTPNKLASGELNFMVTPPQSPSPSQIAGQQFEDDWEDEKEPMQERSGDSPKDESSKKRTKGPWRKSHVSVQVSVLRRLGMHLTEAVRYYAKVYNRTVNSVWRQMMLEVPYGRKANLANLHRQRYRIVHPKHPEEDYIKKVTGILDQAKDKLRRKIRADLVRLGKDIVNVPAGVQINACQRQLQEAVLTANTSIVLKTYLELSTILQSCKVKGKAEGCSSYYYHSLNVYE